MSLKYVLRYAKKINTQDNLLLKHKANCGQTLCAVLEPVSGTGKLVAFLILAT